MEEGAHDKEWARKYILDPLTAPEPSQESGIASSSSAQPRQRSTEIDESRDQFGSSKKKGFFGSALAFRSKGKNLEHSPSPDSRPSSKRSLPTPPTSASPTRSDFHPSNPFASARDSGSFIHTPSESPASSPPRSPPVTNGALGHTRASSSTDPLTTRRYSLNQQPAALAPPSSHRRTTSQPIQRRRSLLNQRYPGDMSHRPLDTIKRDTRAAERGHRRGASTHKTDVIDSLDTIGGTYHHGGPYDATLASRNINKHYSPVAAVQHSNEEALKATPREFITDSLEHHVPLQGVAVIPPGGVDPRGRLMDYEEGADLMREADAPGGAYKRWDHVPYHPEDLKGKGEPSYTLERDTKEKKRWINPAGEYELQSPRHSHSKRSSRLRSSSDVDQSAIASGSAHGHDGMQRSNTTGKRLSDGLKRRVGSLRKKQPMVKEQPV